VREPAEISAAAGVPEVVRVNDEGTKMKSTRFNLDEVGERSVFSCPECNGALWEVDEGVLQYRCHVGHAYSAEALKQAQNVTIEQALWTALRSLKESAALDQRLAERSAEHELHQAADVYKQNAGSKMAQAARLQEFLGSMQIEKK
jgi:two-component system, chemotaxis family, protein-glutamate methylesterase/glutaminase